MYEEGEKLDSECLRAFEGKHSAHTIRVFRGFVV